MLNEAELIDLVENKYFANVDLKNCEKVVQCFSKDSKLTVQTAHVSHNGHDQIRRMFTDFMESTEVIYHGDFTHIIDVPNQSIASQFLAKNLYKDGSKISMLNCNHFIIKDGLFNEVTVYMSGENPLV
jgi:hypothetical protein